MMPEFPNPPETDDEAGLSAWRRAVRRSLLDWRSALDGALHQQYSDQIRTHLAAFLTQRANATVGFYWPIQNEIDLRPVMENHVASGGRAALPVVPGKDMPMVFHDWTLDTEMVPGFAKIPEPANSKEVAVHAMIAPLVGFDRKGYRLGYGGGFFDRTLGVLKRKPLVVGIGFEDTMLDDIRPHRYDVPTDVIITEKGVRFINDARRPDEDKSDQSSPPCHLCS